MKSAYQLTFWTMSQGSADPANDLSLSSVTVQYTNYLMTSSSTTNIQKMVTWIPSIQIDWLSKA